MADLLVLIGLVVGFLSWVGLSVWAIWRRPHIGPTEAALLYALLAIFSLGAVLRKIGELFLNG